MSSGARGGPPVNDAAPGEDGRTLIDAPGVELPDGRTLVNLPGAELPDGRTLVATSGAELDGGAVPTASPAVAPAADAGAAATADGHPTTATLPPVRVILTVQGSGKVSRGRAFDRFPIRLGRAADNDLVIGVDAPAVVAPHHVELRLEGAEVHVRDLRSGRGTFLNDEHVVEGGAGLVHSGDLVRLGAGGPSIKLILLGVEASLGAVPESPMHSVGSSPTLVGPPSSQPLIVVEHLSGPQAGTRRAVAAGRARIGRSEECELLVCDPDAVVSRTHAELTLEDGALWLTDLGSANGTYLNQVRATRARVSSGDIVRLGQNGPALKVSLPPAGAAPPPVATGRPTVLPAGPLPPTLRSDTQASGAHAAAALAQLDRDARDLAELYRGLALRLVAANPFTARAAALDALGPGPLPLAQLWQAQAAADVTYILPELVSHELRVESAARGFVAVPAGVLERLVPDWRRRLPGVPDLAAIASATSLRLLEVLRAGHGDVAGAQLAHARLRAALGPGAAVPAPAAALELIGTLRATLARAGEARLAAAVPIVDAAAADFAAGGAALAAALGGPGAAGLDVPRLHAALRADYRCPDPAQAHELAAVLAALHGHISEASERNLRGIIGL